MLRAGGFRAESLGLRFRGSTMFSPKYKAGSLVYKRPTLSNPTLLKAL